jgi:Rha family phage regulatory protein
MSNTKTKLNVVINPIIPQLTVSENGIPMASSLDIAKVFEKEHKNVLQSIENLFEDIPQDFNELNFQLVEYTDAKGEKRPMYNLTRDAFTLLAMGFTGKKAMRFKVLYIETFNAMEKALLEQSKKRGRKKQEQKEIVEEPLPLSSVFSGPIPLTQSEKEGIQGIIDFIAFLNNASPDSIKEYLFNTMGVPSYEKFFYQDIRDILNILQARKFSIRHPFPRLDNPNRLELAEKAFYGLMKLWSMTLGGAEKEIKNYICNRAGVLFIDDIITEEDYLKGIFIIYHGMISTLPSEDE